MTTAMLEPIARPLAVDVARECELTDAGRALLRDGIKAPQFLAQLAREGLWMDALRFAPFALPRREAVWWACLCLWQFYRPTPPTAADACFKAVVAWLQDGNDAARRAAYEAGQAAKTSTPAGSLAIAVFFHEGSISVVGQPEVPSKPAQLPLSLGAAVTQAIRLSPRAEVASRQNDYVRLALEVLTGRWPVPKK